MPAPTLAKIGIGKNPCHAHPPRQRATYRHEKWSMTADDLRAIVDRIDQARAGISRRCVGDRRLALGGNHQPSTQPSASARFANSHSATSRDPQAEHLNGQSLSGPHTAFERAEPVERHQRTPLADLALDADRVAIGVRTFGRCRGW